MALFINVKPYFLYRLHRARDIALANVEALAYQEGKFRQNNESELHSSTKWDGKTEHNITCIFQQISPPTQDLHLGNSVTVHHILACRFRQASFIHFSARYFVGANRFEDE